MFKVNVPYVKATKVSDQSPAIIDTDVIFQSSDGVLFHIQRKYVEATTGGFPPSSIPTFGQTVALSEDAVTLELLFQFVIPRRHPSLNNIDFQLLLKLAESAEKYEVYAAMNVCNLRMTQMVHLHPVEILNYAIKHDYPDIIAKATPFTLDLELQDVIARLPAQLLVPWVTYRQQWVNAMKSMQRFDWSHSPYKSGSKCSSWSSLWAEVVTKFDSKLSNLRDPDAIFRKVDTNGSEYCCRSAMMQWNKSVNSSVANVTPFEKLL